MRIVVATIPRLERQAVEALLVARRPQHAVVACAAGRLDAALPHLAPDLVVCSQLTARVQTTAPAWLLLYPGGADLGVFRAAGWQTILAGITVDDFLACLDQVAAALDGRAGDGRPRGPETPPLGGEHPSTRRGPMAASPEGAGANLNTKS